MSSAEPRSSRSRIQRSLVPYLILLLSLGITLLFSRYVHRSVQARDQAHFNTSVIDFTTHVRGRSRLYVEVLRAATGLFAASPAIDHQAFTKFVERLELAEQYPGAGGIGFLAQVKRNERESFIREMRRQGLKDFQLSSSGDQFEYNPVIYFEPLSQRDQVALGYDMYTDPVLRAALEAARDSGLPAASGRVTTSGKDAAPGFFIFAPVYKHDETPKTTAERRETLSGFVYAQFNADHLIGSILASRDFGAIDVQIYDAPTPAPDHLLHQTAPLDPREPNSASRLRAATTVDVAGRTWSLAFAARPEFYSSTRGFYETVIGGLLVSLVLFTVTRSQGRARAAAESAASELRLSESRLRKTLNDRERPRKRYARAKRVSGIDRECQRHHHTWIFPAK